MSKNDMKHIRAYHKASLVCLIMTAVVSIYMVATLEYGVYSQRQTLLFLLLWLLSVLTALFWFEYEKKRNERKIEQYKLQRNLMLVGKEMERELEKNIEEMEREP